MSEHSYKTIEDTFKNTEGAVVIIDLQSIPPRDTVNSIISKAKRTGLLFYDGGKGQKPILIKSQESQGSIWDNIIFKDISKDENI